MVEARELMVYGVGIGIPHPKQEQQVGYACADDRLAGPQQIYHPQGDGARDEMQTLPQQVGRIIEVGPRKENNKYGEEGINEGGYLWCHKLPEAHA